MFRQQNVVRFFSFFYCFCVFILFLYSFTQIDLGLTLVKVPQLHQIEMFFKYIGYFMRPLSTWLYIGIIGGLFLSYICIFRFSLVEKVSTRTFRFIIIFTAILLTFSYNAFSYDLFNYIFDAKIVTYYHQNPYFYKALDFPGDPMLAFMHWTHRVYPYGPVWLGISIPLSFIGSNIFIITFFLFKFLAVGSYLGLLWIVGKIVRFFQKKDSFPAQVMLALNPLVLIEYLVSAHHDGLMFFLFFLALWLILQKKYIFSGIVFLASAGIKFVTGLLFPVLGFAIWQQWKKKKMYLYHIASIGLVCMFIACIVATMRTLLQPWYLLFLLPFASLVPRNSYIQIWVLIGSIVGCMLYIPFLFFGNWDSPILLINTMIWGGIATASILTVYVWIGRMKSAKIRK